MIHQIDSKNEWLLLSASFMAKFGLAFVLTLENAISGNFERFQYFNFETDFLENENLFQKTGVPFFS